MRPDLNFLFPPRPEQADIKFREPRPKEAGRLKQANMRPAERI